MFGAGIEIQGVAPQESSFNSHVEELFGLLLTCFLENETVVYQLSFFKNVTHSDSHLNNKSHKVTLKDSWALCSGRVLRISAPPQFYFLISNAIIKCFVQTLRRKEAALYNFRRATDSNGPEGYIFNRRADYFSDVLAQAQHDSSCKFERETQIHFRERAVFTKYHISLLLSSAYHEII